MEVLDLKVKNSQKFINFLQRFAPIEVTLLVEMRKDKMLAKANTTIRDVVKYSCVQLDEIFEESTIDKEIKVGIMNIPKLCTAAKYFSDSFNFRIFYDEVNNENVATGLALRDDKLEMTLETSTMRVFTPISDETIDTLTSEDDALSTFKFTKDNQARLSQLLGFDNDPKEVTITLESKKGKLKACCKTFKLEIGETDGEDFKNEIGKKNYTYVDKEDTICYVKENMIVFVSNESDTKTVIAYPLD